MKKIFTFLFTASVTAFFSAAFAQGVPNPGFENPAGSDTTTATGWKTPNQYTNQIPFNLCEFSRNPSSHSGSWAARLQTKTVATLTVPGIATLGTLSIAGTVSGGIPFAFRPDTLRGFFKHPVSTTDTCYIAVGLFKWNTGTSKRDTIAYAQQYFTIPNTTYAPFAMNLSYLSGSTPDSMNIVLTSSLTHVGSVFYVDDLGFGYLGGVGVQPIVKNNDNFSVYPNPSVNQVFVNTEFNNSNPTTVKVYNLLGKEMYSTVNSLKKQNIDVSNYPAGLYFVEALNNGQKHVQKITVNK
jgi:hypothetical protein